MKRSIIITLFVLVMLVACSPQPVAEAQEEPEAITEQEIPQAVAPLQEVPFAEVPIGEVPTGEASPLEAPTAEAAAEPAVNEELQEILELLEDDLDHAISDLEQLT